METKEKRRQGKTTERESIKDKVSGWISKSPKLEKFVEATSHYIKNPDEFTQKVNELYNRATNKQDNQPISHFAGKIGSLYRMAKMAISGEYTGIPKGQVFMGFAAFVYLVSPVDIVPDFLPFIGFMDDAALLMWLIKNAADQVEKFEQWESTQNVKGINPAY